MTTRQSTATTAAASGRRRMSSVLAGMLSRFWSSAPEAARPVRRARFEALEPRLLLSADGIVGGVTDALATGLAGNPDDGFGDLLEDLIDGETYFDNHVPGVRFDDVETGDAHPTIREALSLDVDQDENGVRITDHPDGRDFVIAILNGSPDIEIPPVRYFY